MYCACVLLHLISESNADYSQANNCWSNERCMYSEQTPLPTQRPGEYKLYLQSKTCLNFTELNEKIISAHARFSQGLTHAEISPAI